MGASWGADRDRRLRFRNVSRRRQYPLRYLEGVADQDDCCGEVMTQIRERGGRTLVQLFRQEVAERLRAMCEALMSGNDLREYRTPASGCPADV